MVSPIIFFATTLFGINCVQGSDIQYENKMKFPSLGTNMQLFWTEGGGYEINYAKNRFEFDSAGKLSQTLFGKLNYEYGEASTSCNVPLDVVKTTGVVETRGSDNTGFTCGECSDALDAACEDGIIQICEYSPEVSGVSPFNNKASNTFAKMCELFYSACSNGRAYSECEVKCSDPEVHGHEAEVCGDDDEDEECIPSLEIALTFDVRDIDLFVTEPTGNRVTFRNPGTYGFLDQDALNGGVETYTMYGDLTGTDMLGDYEINVRCYNGSTVWSIVVYSNGVLLLSDFGSCSSTVNNLYTVTVDTYDDNTLCQGSPNINQRTAAGPEAIPDKEYSP